MLIISEKHTKKDLEIWKDYEEMDAINSKKESLLKKEKTAIEIIKSFSEKNKCYVGISWGKDSVTVADLICSHNIDIPFVHLYVKPSHNFECDKVRDNFIKKYANINYIEIVVDYGDIHKQGLSEIEQDKITDKLFYEGFKKAEKKFGNCHISGVRKEESGRRRLRMRRWGLMTINTLAPIGYWSNEDVFAYLYKYDLPIHSNYAMFGNGLFNRKHIRVAELGDISGSQYDRKLWESIYFRNELNLIKSV